LLNTSDCLVDSSKT